MIPELVDKTSCVLDAVRQQGDGVFKILSFLRGNPGAQRGEGPKPEHPSAPLDTALGRLEDTSRELERIRDDLASVTELLGVSKKFPAPGTMQYVDKL